MFIVSSDMIVVRSVTMTICQFLERIVICLNSVIYISDFIRIQLTPRGGGSLDK